MNKGVSEEVPDTTLASLVDLERKFGVEVVYSFLFVGEALVTGVGPTANVDLLSLKGITLAELKFRNWREKPREVPSASPLAVSEGAWLGVWVVGAICFVQLSSTGWAEPLERTVHATSTETAE